MTWETTAVILGVIGGIIIAIIKLTPQRDLGDSSLGARIIKLETQNESLRLELRNLRVELAEARAEIRRLSDAILKFLQSQTTKLLRTE